MRTNIDFFTYLRAHAESEAHAQQILDGVVRHVGPNTRIWPVLDVPALVTRAGSNKVNAILIPPKPMKLFDAINAKVSAKRKLGGAMELNDVNIVMRDETESIEDAMKALTEDLAENGDRLHWAAPGPFHFLAFKPAEDAVYGITLGDAPGSCYEWAKVTHAISIPVSSQVGLKPLVQGGFFR